MIYFFSCFKLQIAYIQLTLLTGQIIQTVINKSLLERVVFFIPAPEIPHHRLKNLVLVLNKWPMKFTKMQT